MSAATHTPGPWAIARDPRDGMEWNNHIVCATKPHLAVCFMSHDGDGVNATGEANASLIAAAPDLLAALRKFLTAAKSWHDFHHGSETVQCDWLCECIAPGEAAIAKAEGNRNV